jgi:hypothetical protein
VTSDYERVGVMAILGRRAARHRLDQVDLVALVQRRLLPAPARHDLAVDGHGHAAPIAALLRHQRRHCRLIGH